MAANEIKTTLAIDGEASYKKAISEAANELKVLGLELKLNSSEMKLNGETTQNLATRQGILSKEIQTQQKYISTLNSAIEDSVGANGEATKATQGYEEKLLKAKIALNAMEGDLRTTEATLGNAGHATENLSELTEDLSKAQGDSKGVLGGWQNALDDAGESLGGMGQEAGSSETAVRDFGQETMDSEKAIATAELALKELSSELRLNAAEYQGNADSAEALATKTDILKQKAAEQQKIVDELTAAVARSTAQYGENSEATVKYKTTLNDAKATLTDLMGEIETKEQRLKELNQKLGEGADQTKKLGDEQENTAKKSGGLSSALKGVASVSAAIAKQVADLAKELYGFAKDVAETGNNVDKMSQKLGMSRQGYQEWSYILDQNGASIDSMQGGLTRMNRAMDDAMQGSDGAAEKFARLGISLEDIKNSSREDIFGMVVSGLQGVTDETEKAAIANSLLGGSATQLIPLLNQSAESTEALRAKAHQLGAVLSDDAINSSVAFSDAMTDLNYVFEAVRNKIGLELLPGLTSLAEGLTGMVTGVEGASDQFKAGVMELTDGVITILRDMLPVLLDIGGEVLFSLLDGLLDALPVLLAELPALIMTLQRFIVDNLPALIDMGTDLIVSLAMGMVEALPYLVAALPEILDALLDGLLRAIPALLEVGVEMVKGLWEGIKSMAGWLLDQVGGFIDDLLGGFLTKLGIRSPSTVMADMIGKPMAEGIAMGIDDGAGEVDAALEHLMPDAMPNAMETGLNAVSGAMDKTASGMVSAIGSMADATHAGGQRISEGYSAMAEDVLSTVEALVDPLTEAGDASIQGWIDGLEARHIDLMHTVEEMSNDLVNTIKRVLGIASPAKVTYEIGENTVFGLRDGIKRQQPITATEATNMGSELIKGLVTGIAGEEPWLKDYLEQLANSMIDWLKAAFGIESPSRLMAEAIGLPVAQGVAKGIDDNAYLVHDALEDLIPDPQTLEATLDVNRRFNDLVGAAETQTVSRNSEPRPLELSDSSVDRIVSGMMRAYWEMPEPVVELDAREVGRFVREAVPA